MSKNKYIKAKDLVKNKKVKQTAKGFYYVVGESDTYKVIYKKNHKRKSKSYFHKSCDCQYFSIHLKTCSHILAVKEFRIQAYIKANR